MKSATLGCGAVGRGDGVAADEARGSGEPDGRGAIVGATVGLLVAGADALEREIGGPIPSLFGNLWPPIGATWAAPLPTAQPAARSERTKSADLVARIPMTSLSGGV
jgi:hypothetical protein